VHFDSKRQKPFPGDLASWLGIAGFGSFMLALVLNVGIAIEVARRALEPVYPPVADRIFLILVLWGFAIPVAWSYRTRFVTIFAGPAIMKRMDLLGLKGPKPVYVLDYWAKLVMRDLKLALYKGDKLESSHVRSAHHSLPPATASRNTFRGHTSIPSFVRRRCSPT
jgi:hypothetical protein